MKNGKEGVVREIMMGSPVTLKPEDTLDLANDVISLGRIRHIPVVDDGRLAGLLSERDLIGAAATTIFGLKQKSKSALLKSFLIKDVMKKKLITVKPDTLIKDAAHLMKEKRIGCVPVVSDGVSRVQCIGDLLRGMASGGPVGRPSYGQSSYDQPDKRNHETEKLP
jgi:CBS domain-containing protein